jgi:hypothetical protein
MVQWAQRLRDAQVTPSLADSVANFAHYETVFLGFPIWGAALPAPVRTFVATYDLSDKTLVPFITHGGYGPGSAPAMLAELAPGVRLVSPFVLQCDQERDTLNRVSSWLRRVEAEL